MAEPVAYLPDGTPLADDQLHQAIANGQARFKGGQPVHFVDAEGQHFSVPGEEAWRQIKRGAKPLTGAEFSHYEAVKKAGESYGEAAKTVGTGLARTLTFGLSDPALQAIDPGYAQAEQVRQEAQPFLKEAGEIAGYALPIAGEIGLGGRAVKALTAAPRALSKVARGAGEAVTKGLGEGVGKRVLRGGIEGGIEGTGFGVQQGISQQTIDNEPLTWQRIALNSAMGAGLGGLLGSLPRFGKKATQAEQTATKVERPSLLEPASVAEVAESGKPSLLDKFQQKAADASVGMEMRGAGYRGSDIAKFTKEGGPETVARYARRMRSEAGIGAGDSIKDIYSKQLAQKAEAGAEFNAISRRLEDNGFRVDAAKALDDIDNQILKPLRESSVADTRRMANRIDDGILSDLRKQVQGTSEEFLAQQKSLVRDLVKQERGRLFEEAQLAPGYVASRANDRAVLRGIDEQLQGRATEFRDLATQQLREQGVGVPKSAFSFDEWRAIRQEIDKKLDLSKARGDLTEKGKIVRDIRDQMERSLSSQIGEGVKKPLADAYSAAKLRYKDWATMSDALKHRMGVTEGNRFVSLTDTIAAAEGAQAHGAPGAIIGALLNKTIRSPQASRIGAEIANKVAGKRAVLGAGDVIRESAEAAGRIGQRVEETVAGASSRLPQFTKAAAYQIPVATSKGAANLLEFISHVQQSRNEIGSQLTQIAGLDDVPGVQQEAALSQAKTLQILADLAPHPDQPLNPALGEHQPPPPESLSHEYAEIVRMLDKPGKVFDKFDDGSLTRKQVAIINALLPDVQGDLQKSATTAMAKQIDAGRTPNYQMRLRLGMLTGVPVDPSDTPGFAATVQGIYQSMPVGQQPGPQPHARKQASKSRISGRRKSTLERIEEET